MYDDFFAKNIAAKFANMVLRFNGHSAPICARTGTADRALVVLDAELQRARVFEYACSGSADHCVLGVLCGELLVCAGANNSLTVLS